MQPLLSRFSLNHLISIHVSSIFSEDGDRGHEKEEPILTTRNPHMVTLLQVKVQTRFKLKYSLWFCIPGSGSGVNTELFSSPDNPPVIPAVSLQNAGY